MALTKKEIGGNISEFGIQGVPLPWVAGERGIEVYFSDKGRLLEGDKSALQASIVTSQFACHLFNSVRGLA